MEHKRRNIDKLSTLDAAQRIYFILAALAIRESFFPGSMLSPPNPTFVGLAKLSMTVGYLVTLVRFSHGISLLHGSVKAKVEQSQLPTAGGVAVISVFLVSLGIFLFLMADSIASLSLCLLWFLFLLALDFILVLKISRFASKNEWGNIFYPRRKVKELRKRTITPHMPAVALQWLASDFWLAVVSIIFLIWDNFPGGSFVAGFESFRPLRYLAFGLVLILFSLWDYWSNREYYFGDLGHKRRRFVLVYQPQFGKDENKRSTIGALEEYCRELLNESNGRFAPLAPQAFYSHFVDLNKPEECALARSCAIAFIRACEEMHVVGMSEEAANEELEVKIARSENLAVKSEEHVNMSNKSADWEPYVAEGDSVCRLRNDLFRTDLRRVYVCTNFRAYSDQKCNGTRKYDLRKMNEYNLRTLWLCRRLITKENVAPIAPHAFYPYFWTFVHDGCEDVEKYQLWFSCSRAILEICDAVYVYTSYDVDGCPETSPGMNKIIEFAESLGLEIQYRTIPQGEKKLNTGSPAFLKIQ
jgi:hypothetical protein